MLHRGAASASTSWVIASVLVVALAACRSDGEQAAEPLMLGEIALPDSVTFVMGVVHPEASYAAAVRLVGPHLDRLGGIRSVPGHLPTTIGELAASGPLGPLAGAFDWSRPVRLVALGDGPVPVLLVHLTSAAAATDFEGERLAIAGVQVMRLGPVLVLSPPELDMTDELRRWLPVAAGSPQREDLELILNVAGVRRRNAPMWQAWMDGSRARGAEPTLARLLQGLARILESSDRATLSVSLADEGITVDLGLALAPGSPAWDDWRTAAPIPLDAVASAGSDAVFALAAGLGEGLPPWLVEVVFGKLREEDATAAGAARSLLADLRGPALIVEHSGSRPSGVLSWDVSHPVDTRDRLFTAISRLAERRAVVEAIAVVGSDSLDMVADDAWQMLFGVVEGRAVLALGESPRTLLGRHRDSSEGEAGGIARALERGLPHPSVFAWTSVEWLDDPAEWDGGSPPGVGVALTAGTVEGRLRARLDLPSESLGVLASELLRAAPTDWLTEEGRERRRREAIDRTREEVERYKAQMPPLPVGPGPGGTGAGVPSVLPIVPDSPDLDNAESPVLYVPPPPPEPDLEAGTVSPPAEGPGAFPPAEPWN